MYFLFDYRILGILCIDSFEKKEEGKGCSILPVYTKVNPLQSP